MPRIGLSKPYAALYTNSGSTVTYSGCAVIGQFVSLNISLDTGNSNDFYSDNGPSEEDNQFPGGTAEAVTNDLSPEDMVRVLGMTQEPITDVPGVTTEGAAWIVNNDNQQTPFVGFGGIAKRKLNGVIGYVAVVLDKVRFRNFNDSINTQGETIEWQTPTLTADIFRSDTATHDWRRYSTVFPTEAEAEAALVAYLGGAAATGGGT